MLCPTCSTWLPAGVQCGRCAFHPPLTQIRTGRPPRAQDFLAQPTARLVIMADALAGVVSMLAQRRHDGEVPAAE